jgi:hypothetical protein
MPAEVQLRRFRENTRKHTVANSTGVQAIDLANTYNYDLDKIGLCTGVWLKTSGTVTLSAAGALANMGPWSLYDRIKIKTASGAALFDAFGYDVYQLNKRLKRSWAPDGGGVFTAPTTVFNAPVAMGANTWAQHLWLPFSENRGSSFDSGIFGLQSNVTQATVELTTTAAAANFVSNFTSEALTTELFNEYYEPPLEGSNVAMPPAYVIKTITTNFPVVAAGEQLLEIPRQGILLDAQLLFINNAVRSNTIDYVRYRTNYGDHFEHQTLSINNANYMELYGSAPDTGVFFFDFDSAGDLPKTGDMRDVFNLLKYSKSEIVANITAGTTITQPSSLRLLTRHWLPAKVVR